MKTVKLPFNKVSNPANYSLIVELMSFDNVSYDVSKSQLLKRLDSAVASELIDLAKAGEEIEIIG